MTATTLPERRIRIYHEAAEASRAMEALDSAVSGSGLDETLADLVRLRASQVNGCAYCVDMHSKDLRARGESEERIYGVSAWREAPFYSERERAALALTEAMTLIAGRGIPDDVYEAAAGHFETGELAALIWTVVTINAWNRLAITARDPEPGTYQP